MRRYGWVSLGLVLLALSLSTTHAYQNLAYVWQRDWNNCFRQAVAEIEPEIDSLTVLCGDFRYQNGKAVINSVDIDWSSLAGKDLEIVLAFRINAQSSELFRTKAIYPVLEGIEATVNKAISSAGQAGINVSGVQFDYDCPTSKLADYTERLWRSIKYKEVYLHDYQTPREAKEGLSKYLAFYNQERPHQSLDCRTPAQGILW